LDKFPLWGTVSKTKLKYRPASPFGVETKIYRESLNQDYTLLRHIDGDSDKKFNIVEVERPRFDGSGVSLERVFLSPTNGQPVLREFFEGRNDRSPLWQEQYEYNYPAVQSDYGLGRLWTPQTQRGVSLSGRVWLGHETPCVARD
jgi:hypothetical protein